MGKSIFFGVSDTAHHGKAAWIGVDGVAHKVKAVWMGVNGVARLCYQSLIKLFATAAYSRAAGDKTSAATLSIKAKDSDNIVLTFPADSAYLTCEKLTLHINSQTSSRTLKTIALRRGSTTSSSISVSAGIATTVPAYTISSAGWQAIDVTAGFTDDGGVTRELAAAEGIKIWLRTSSGTCTISGVNSDECPYLTLDSAGSSSPDTPDTPTQSVAFVVEDDGSVTLENVSFTQLSDGSVQIDNATFTVQDDGSVLVQ